MPVPPLEIPMNVDDAGRYLTLLSQLTRSRNRSRAETVLFKLLETLGFDSVRLYYQDNHGHLVGAKAAGLKPRGRAQRFEDGSTRIPFVEGTSDPGAIASYVSVHLNEPIVVRVSPGSPTILTPVVDTAGVPTIFIPSAPLQAELGRPPQYEWLDIPLSSSGHVFGKLSLDKQMGTEPITYRDFALAKLLLAPLSDALSSTGWFGSAELPHALVDEFWREYSKIRAFDDLPALITDYIRTSFNALQCSVFLAQHPVVPSSLLVSQPRQLVLWSTTFDGLKGKEKSAFYLPGEGLTGRAWEQDGPFYLGNIRSNGDWMGKHNDSRTHAAFVAATIPPGTFCVEGLVRIPEGRRHLLLEVDAKMLSRFASSVLAPAIDTILLKERLHTLESLERCFREHLAARREMRLQGNSTAIWDYAASALDAIYSLDHKTIVVYSIDENDRLRIERTLGGLPLVRSMSEGRLLPKSSSTAVGRMIQCDEPILLTNVGEARKQASYRSVVKGVKSAAVVPIRLDGHCFGAIAITSDRYDLLAARELSGLKLVADQCAELRELEGIVSRAERDAHAHALEATAYQVKNPALQLRTHGRRILRSIESGDEPARETVERTIAAVRHLWMATDRVLYAVENMRPYLRVASEPADDLFAGLQRTVESFMDGYYHRKSLKLESRTAIPAGFACDVDAELVGTAVLCIAENAMKVSRTRGRLRLVGRIDRRNRRLMVSVRDEGRGIPANIRSRIFDPAFRRKYERGKHVVEGAGFGLFVARRIVEAHGGQISVRTDGESFAEFTICLRVKVRRQRR